MNGVFYPSSPILSKGFSLEKFDGIGFWKRIREEDNGENGKRENGMNHPIFFFQMFKRHLQVKLKVQTTQTDGTDGIGHQNTVST